MSAPSGISGRWSWTFRMLSISLSGRLPKYWRNRRRACGVTQNGRSKLTYDAPFAHTSPYSPSESRRTLPRLSNHNLHPRLVPVHVDHRRQNRHNAAMVVLKRVALEPVEDGLATGDSIVGVATAVIPVVKPVLNR